MIAHCILLSLTITAISGRNPAAHRDTGAGPLDCVRIRSYSQRRLVYGTGYFIDSDRCRVVAVWNHNGVPWNSAFRFERVPDVSEPVYYVNMINVREYLQGSPTYMATHETRLPVVTHHAAVNTTRNGDGIWGFIRVPTEKLLKCAECWYIKNIMFNEYMIASMKLSDPPKHAKNEVFKTVKLDRKNQPILGPDHMFYFEDC